MSDIEGAEYEELTDEEQQIKELDAKIRSAHDLLELEQKTTLDKFLGVVIPRGARKLVGMICDFAKATHEAGGIEFTMPAKKLEENIEAWEPWAQLMGVTQEIEETALLQLAGLGYLHTLEGTTSEDIEITFSWVNG